MWDTAGSERFRTIPLSYYHLADGILLLFDVTSQYRFDGIPEWITFIKTHLNGTANKNNPISFDSNKIQIKQAGKVNGFVVKEKEIEVVEDGK